MWATVVSRRSKGSAAHADSALVDIPLLYRLGSAAAEAILRRGK
jgi:hypothetical protein